MSPVSLEFSRQDASHVDCTSVNFGFSDNNINVVLFDSLVENGVTHKDDGILDVEGNHDALL